MVGEMVRQWPMACAIPWRPSARRRNWRWRALSPTRLAIAPTTSSPRSIALRLGSASCSPTPNRPCRTGAGGFERCPWPRWRAHFRDLERRGIKLSVKQRRIFRRCAAMALLTQMLGNLIANAGEAMTARGSIVLSANREGEEIVVGVRDDGFGNRPRDMGASSNLLQYETQRAGIGIAAGTGVWPNVSAAPWNWRAYPAAVRWSGFACGYGRNDSPCGSGYPEALFRDTVEVATARRGMMERIRSLGEAFRRRPGPGLVSRRLGMASGILVIDDEAVLAKNIRLYLERSGYEVHRGAPKKAKP